MKKILLLSVLCAVNIISARSQEPVLPFSMVQQPFSWYKQQSAAWRSVIDKQPADARAWFNYYYANRLLQKFDQEDKRPAGEKAAAMEQLLKEMGTSIPDSYEYNLVRWMAGGIDMKNLPYLKKAMELGPGRTEHLDAAMNIAELQRDHKSKLSFARKKYDAKLVSPGMLHYNYNVLTGLPQNAILITAGDNDTYPAWVLQSLGHRTDVKVINIFLLQSDEYRKKLFEELGVAPWEDLWKNDQAASDAALTRFRKGILRHLAANRHNHPVMLALSAGNLIEESEPSVEGQLYLTGLAFQYSGQPLDNIGMLRANFEKNFVLDYLEHSFYPDVSGQMVRQMNMNYIVPMMKLYDHYRDAGDRQRLDWIARKLAAVSNGTPAEEEVNAHMKQQ